MEVFSFLSVHESILEMSGSWDMGQNAFGQSNCRILKLFVSVELIEEIPGVLVCCYKLIKLKVYLKFWVDLSKYGLGHPGHRSLK